MKTIVADFYRFIRNPKIYVIATISALAAISYTFYDWSKKGHESLQKLPRDELEIISKFDEDQSASLDPRELRNLLQEYKLEKREKPINLPEVPRFGMALEKKVESR